MKTLTNQTTTAKEHFTPADTLVVKGMAILCLLFYHLFEHTERVTSLQVNYSPLPLDTFLLLSSFGNICVAVFAFLSAYGITAGIMQKEAAGVPSALSFSALYKGSCVRYGKLTLNFTLMYCSINLLWFSKFDYAGLYGSGWQGGLYTLLDATGLANLFKTPTINQTWWYMELAILIVFIVPLLYLVVKKLGYYVIPLGILLPVAVELQFDVKRYYFVILLGVLAASKQWFEKFFAMKLFHRPVPMWAQAVAGVILLSCSVIFRQNYVVYSEFAYLVDAPIALLFAWFGAVLPARIPGVRHILILLGRHSMNIYFVHTFFYMAIYQQFIYSFRYAGLIFLVLTLICLGYSLVLEGIKKMCRTDRWIPWVTAHFHKAL